MKRKNFLHDHNPKTDFIPSSSTSSHKTISHRAVVTVDCQPRISSPGLDHRLVRLEVLKAEEARLAERLRKIPFPTSECPQWNGLMDEFEMVIESVDALAAEIGSDS